MSAFYFLYRLIFLTILMFLITEWKYSFKRTCLIITVFIIAVWAINSSILYTFGLDFSNAVYPLTVSIPVFLLFVCISNMQFFCVLFSFISVCNLGMFTSFCGMAAYYFSGSFSIKVISEILWFFIISVIIILFVKGPYFNVISFRIHGWGYLCTVPSMLSVIIYLSLYYPTEYAYWPENIAITISIFLLMFSYYLIMYLNFERISQFFQIRNEREFMELQSQLHKKEYNSMHEKLESLQLFRHDARHHLNAVKALLDDNNITDARTYLKRFDSHLKETLIERYCDNYIVNVVLSAYIERARTNDISVTCHAEISDALVLDSIDSFELSSLFANAIENAINACLKSEDSNARRISINCREHGSQLYIRISNPTYEEITFDGDFPVSNAENHGFGTKSIAAVARKNGGLFSFEVVDGEFLATIILNKTQ